MNWPQIMLLVDLTDNEEQISQSAGLFVNTGEQHLHAFKTMLEHKNTVLCGKSTAEQKAFLFDAIQSE